MLPFVKIPLSASALATRHAVAVRRGEREGGSPHSSLPSGRLRFTQVWSSRRPVSTLRSSVWSLRRPISGLRPPVPLSSLVTRHSSPRLSRLSPPLSRQLAIQFSRRGDPQANEGGSHGVRRRIPSVTQVWLRPVLRLKLKFHPWFFAPRLPPAPLSSFKFQISALVSLLPPPPQFSRRGDPLAISNSTVFSFQHFSVSDFLVLCPK